MDCNELFSMFEKLGGKFICKYDKNQGILLPQNLKCNNLEKAAYKIDCFLLDHSMYTDMFKDIKTPLDRPMKKIDHKDMSLIEISMKFCSDNYGIGYICVINYK